MAHTVAKPDIFRTSSALAIPTVHETALFLIAPIREAPTLLQEWDEESIMNNSYYSPTSD